MSQSTANSPTNLTGPKTAKLKRTRQMFKTQKDSSDRISLVLVLVDAPNDFINMKYFYLFLIAFLI